MLSAKHANHLLGHILATVIRREFSSAEILQSKDHNNRFWVEATLPGLISEEHLNSWKQNMHELIFSAKTFCPVVITLDEISHIFPRQEYKKAEAIKLAEKHGNIIPGYQLEEQVDFCSCKMKSLDHIKELTDKVDFSLQSMSLVTNDPQTSKTTYKIEGQTLWKAEQIIIYQ
jgi:threonyl-tRNA synthetase